MSKKFKYQQDMDTIKNNHDCDCPGTDLKEIIPFLSYRFVFEDLSHKSNFLPQLKSDPARFIDADGKKKCNYLSLSMYSKIEAAKERYYQLLSTFPNFNKTAGTHIANGEIDSEDGLITKEGSYSHFELYEFENVELKDKFSVVEKL